ncbi:MAG: response regulator transcription factor [Pseudomonadota bacterium]
MTELTVVIADDHQIVRDGLRDALFSAAPDLKLEFRIAATASNGLEALSLVKQHQPDLLFLDISMPLATGAEIVNDLQRWSPDTRIVVFTGIVAPGLLASMVDSGVQGIFSKTAPLEEMTNRLPLLLQGGHYIAPDLVTAIEQGQQSAQLTERERQTLNMVIAGKSNKEIARLMNISPKTVDKHRTSLMQKLEVHSIAELMARALRDGLIDSGGLHP